MRAIDSIKKRGRDLVIQSLERKNESVVIRTQSHQSVDKAAIYAEVKAQTAVDMNLLQQEKQSLVKELEWTKDSHQRERTLLTQQKDEYKNLLENLAFTAANKPTIMNDYSRNINNSTIGNSALNQGNASTVSNHIEQVADNELKTALQALQQLIAQSALPDLDKQEAQKSLDELATASHKPGTERKSLARRSLAFLKDLSNDLSSSVEIGKQYHQLIVKIMLWFL